MTDAIGRDQGPVQRSTKGLLFPAVVPEDKGTKAMLRYLLRVLVVCTIAIIVLAVTAFADDQPANRSIQEEVWAIPVILPTIAYVVRPVGDGPFPLVVMNHGVSLNQRERSFFPLVEFRDAAIVVRPEGLHGGCALRFRIWRSSAR
ncbi:MAG: hypothetical protein WDN50_16790 [Bradyrhizobium sp.]